MTVTDKLRWSGIKPTAAAAEEPGKQVAIGDVTTEILAANEDRTAFTLIVRGSANVFVSLSDTATANSVELEPGDILSSDDYTGDVHGIEPGDDGKVHVFEV